MKKIIYILPLLFVFLITSCEVEKSEKNYPTIYALSAFNFVENSIWQSVDLLDLMTKVSYYGEAPANKKEEIKKYLLSSYTIANTANSWSLKNDTKEITFTHNNKAINEAGAIWTAKVSIKSNGETAQMLIDDKNYKVQCLGEKSWKISTLNFAYYQYSEGNTTADLNIVGIDADEKAESIYDFKVETGSGVANLGNSKLTYNVLKSATYIYNKEYQKLIINDGDIEININDDSDKINAEIISPDLTQSVKITYKGFTEIY